MVKKIVFLLFVAGVLFSPFSPVVLYGAIPASERAALIDFYNATGGDSWTGNSGWKTPPLDADGFAMPGTESGWFGLTVSGDNVIQIDMGSNNLSGSLPASIQDLTELRYLMLNSNNISGSLPTQIGNLSDLRYLWLSGNNISGSFPSALGNLTQLTSLNLGSNNLGGTLPTEIGNMTSLSSLMLSYNHISGTIPSSIGNLTQLTSLNLGNNQFYGSIPTTIKNMANLQFLYLDDNWLSGPIPAEIGDLAALKFLYLSSNSFNGSIPSEIGNLSNLMILELDFNYLSGTIPPQLGNLDNLTQLDFKSNQLTGAIPAELGNMDKIQTLRFSRNKLTGPLPVEITNISTLRYLYLGANNFVGPVPDSLLNLSAAYYIELSLNGFYTDDSALLTFLTVKSPFWATSQTIPPSDVSGTVNSSTAVTINWTPIEYTSGTGSYRVYASTTSGSGYTLAAETADKSASSISVTGLNPGTTYYFVVNTKTAASINNQNELISDYSSEISLTTQAGAVGQYNLSVQSSPVSGVPVTVNPNDKNGNGNGQTSFSRTYLDGASVTLTAPAQHNGESFLKWTIDSADNTNNSVTLTMNRNHTAIAYYDTTDDPPPVSSSTITLGREAFNFGSDHNFVTPAQVMRIAVTGDPVDWTAAADVSWIQLSPASGSQTAEVSVSIDTRGLSTGRYTGTITVTAPDAENSPQTAPVILNLYDPNTTTGSTGYFGTPGHNSTVCSSVPVTGWVVDEIGVQNVEIYLEAGDPNNLLYIDDALLVEGARPDVEAAYPEYPKSYQAGWGYMMLTNFLPNGGNGTFTIHAFATDVEGHRVSLGSKTVIVDNANAVKPFGAIDTPAQGGTASGSSFINWGWALTPQPNSIPVDGSTIDVFVNGVKAGNPTYNLPRPDIAAFFPDYANKDAAAGYFVLDTTGYENKVYTIQWTVTDSAGNRDGIGSRFFKIDNTGVSRNAGQRTSAKHPDPLDHIYTESQLGSVHLSMDPVRVTTGYNENTVPRTVSPGENNLFTVQMNELGRLELHLDTAPVNHNTENRYYGFLLVNRKLKPLPTGSCLDKKNGIFYWQPGIAFNGAYSFVFVTCSATGKLSRKTINIYILPKSRPTR